MASFTIDLYKIGKVQYSTIQGYIWALCEAHTRSGYDSPLDNVPNWDVWMSALEVQIYSVLDHPGDSHHMLEFNLLVDALFQVDKTSRFEVACANIYLCCYYTHSRV